MGDAFLLLNQFLREDASYLQSSLVYGDRGEQALSAALDIFLKRPSLGFVWLTYEAQQAAAVCVVCYAVSTSIGGLVAKLDDVYVAQSSQRRGVGTHMLQSLAAELRRQGVLRIDTSVHMSNDMADGLYRKLGFKKLGEERLALVL
jgi:ribosomal protein S18 acetylase RimI-like enzyme